MDKNEFIWFSAAGIIIGIVTMDIVLSISWMIGIIIGDISWKRVQSWK